MEKYLIEKLEERLKAITDELERVRYEKVYTKSSITVIECIDNFVNAIKYNLNELTHIDYTKYYRLFDIKIRLYSKTIMSLYIFLGIVDRTNTEDIPIELIHPLTKYIDIYIPKSQLLLNSLPFFNYTLTHLGNTLEKTRRDLDIHHIESGDDKGVVCVTDISVRKIVKLNENPDYGKIPPGLFVLSIPKVEKNNVLYHALLGHEIGHALFEQNRKAFFVHPGEEGEEALTLAAESGDINIQKYKGDLGIYYKNWLAEIVCDIIGLFLFGPAYFFAFTDLFIPVSRLD